MENEKNFEFAPDGESLRKKREELLNNIEKIEEIEQKLGELKAILERETTISNNKQSAKDSEDNWLQIGKEKYLKEIRNKVNELEEILNNSEQQN